MHGLVGTEKPPRLRPLDTKNQFIDGPDYTEQLLLRDRALSLYVD